MRSLIMFALLSGMIPFVGSQTTQQSNPLTDLEKKQIAVQLNGYISCVGKVAECEADKLREQEILARERASWQGAVDIEKQRTELKGRELEVKQKEIDLVQKQADLYKNLYEAVTKKPSWGCRILNAIPIIGIIWHCR